MVHNPYLAALFISVMQATTTIFYSEWSFSSVTLQLVVAPAVCDVVIGITVWLFPMKTLLWLLLSETAKVHNMELYYNLIAVLICMLFFIAWCDSVQFYFITRSSAIAEGPRDASCQLKSCQLPRSSAETTYTTSPDQIDGMKLRFSWRQCMIDNVHSTMTRSSRLPLSQVS